MTFDEHINVVKQYIIHNKYEHNIVYLSVLDIANALKKDRRLITSIINLLIHNKWLVPFIDKARVFKINDELEIAHTRLNNAVLNAKKSSGKQEIDMLTKLERLKEQALLEEYRVNTNNN